MAHRRTIHDVLPVAELYSAIPAKKKMRIGDRRRLKKEKNEDPKKEKPVKKKREDDEKDSSDPESETDETAEDEWEVKCIVDISNEVDGETLYRVRWKGWGAKSDTWEKEANLSNCRENVQIFLSFRDIGWKVNGKCIFTSEILEWAQESIRSSLSNVTFDFPILCLLVGRLADEKTTRRGIDVNVLIKTLRSKIVDNPALVSEQDILDRTFRDPYKGFVRISRFLEIAPFDLYDAAILFKSRQKSQTVSKLVAYQRDLRKKIQKAEGLDYLPRVIIENWLDDQVPERFRYIKNYSIGRHTVVRDDLLNKCFCQGVCVSTCFCISENRSNLFKKTKTKNPILKAPGRTPIFECSSECTCSCEVKGVTDYMNFSFSIFRTQSRGWGLRTCRKISKGEFVCVYAGEIVDENERLARQMNHDPSYTYLFDLDYNNLDNPPYSVDAEYMGNLARFINHSCDPNLNINPIFGEFRNVDCPLLGFFAARQIAVNEELCIDYNAIRIHEFIVPEHMATAKKKTPKGKGKGKALVPSSPPSPPSQEAEKPKEDFNLKKNPSADHANPQPLSSNDDDFFINPQPGPSKMAKTKDNDDEDDEKNPNRAAPGLPDDPDENNGDPTLKPCYCQRSCCRGFIF